MCLNYNTPIIWRWVQCRHLILALDAWTARALYTTVRHPVFWAWMRPQVPDLTTDCGFDSQTTRVIVVLGLFFDRLSMGVCITGHCQTSGRLVLELNGCTVVKGSWSRLAYTLRHYLGPCFIDGVIVL